MAEYAGGLRACAVLDSGCRVLARTGGGDWGPAAEALLEAADAGAPEAAGAVHVGTADGEVFAVREGGLVMLAVTERFVLGSLVLSDMRSLTRDLAAGEVPDRRAPGPGAQP